MSLNVTIPFQHRDHQKTWRLISENGQALLPRHDCRDEVIDGLVYIAPADQLVGISSMAIERMIAAERLSRGLINAVASPF
jgi:hypothetical protein